MFEKRRARRGTILQKALRMNYQLVETTLVGKDGEVG